MRRRRKEGVFPGFPAGGLGGAEREGSISHSTGFAANLEAEIGASSVKRRSEEKRRRPSTSYGRRQFLFYFFFAGPY